MIQRDAKVMKVITYIEMLELAEDIDIGYDLNELQKDLKRLNQ